jgi:hypothetical protein
MPRRKFNVAEVLLAETTPLVETEDKTAEDYQKLNEKCDQLISKIKVRKERKRKK